MVKAKRVNEIIGYMFKGKEARFINEAESLTSFRIKKARFEPASAPWYDIGPVSYEIKNICVNQEKIIKERQPNIATIEFRILGQILDGNDVLASTTFTMDPKFHKYITFTDLVNEDDVESCWNKQSEFSKKVGYTLRNYFRRKFATRVPFTYVIEYGRFYDEHKLPLIKGPHVMDMSNEFDLKNFIDHGASPLLGQGHFSAQKEELVDSLRYLYELCPDFLIFNVTDGKIYKTYYSDEEELIFNRRVSLRNLSDERGKG